jgi:hypothetical protein
MKTILIPTNFDEQSLQLIKSAILLYPDTLLDIILVSGYKMKMNKYDLMQHSTQRIIRKSASSSFLKKIKELKLEHRGSILDVKFDLFLGTNKYSFDNFLKENRIDLAVLPNRILDTLLSKSFFSITPYIKKSNISSTQINVRKVSNPPVYSPFSFFNFKNQFNFKFLIKQ